MTIMRVVTEPLWDAYFAARFVAPVLHELRAFPNTEALVGPTGALPNQDLLPLCSRGGPAFQSCAVLDGRLSRAAEFAWLSRDLVSRWLFFLLVR